MASSLYSKDRVYCPDYRVIHKKHILRTKDFRCVTDIGVEAVKAILPTESASKVKETDYICRACFRYFCGKVSDREPVDLSPPTERSSEGDQYVPQPDAVDAINQYITSAGIDVTPVKPKRRSVQTYAKRKCIEIREALGKKASRKIETAFGVAVPGTSKSEGCQSCGEWIGNMRTAYNTSASLHERCRLLTLLPASWPESKIMEAIPEATRYMVRKSKKLRKDKHVWAAPDPYQGHPLSEEHVNAALEFFTSDELDCSVQSPRPRDVIQVQEAGVKVSKPKRYMTRSIRETYELFRMAHPDIKLNLTKFYSLRPKWVSISPCREECVCVYCANFELCAIAINNASASTMTTEKLINSCLCAERQEACFLGECRACPGREALTVENLQIPEDADALEMALWEHGGLVKKVLPLQSFLDVVRHWVVSYISHDYTRSAQRQAIRKEKQGVLPGTVVFHFDFAENWTVILPNEIQSYHWKKTQISIFTCVVTAARGVTHSYAVVSDDTRHDTAAALHALQKIDDHIDENGPIYGTAIYISDGASAHFKNRFQFYEMRTNCALKKWVFSAPGHGKNACDGIGGVVKHAATVHNLRSPAVHAIQNASELVRALSGKLQKVTLVHLPSEELQSFRRVKLEKWKSAPSIQGLRSHFVWEKCKQDQPSEITLRKIVRDDARNA